METNDRRPGARPGGGADLDDLRRLLLRIDGRGYPAYKEIRGRYRAPRFTLHIDHVQGDPFAEPSRLRVTVDPGVSALPEWTHATPVRRIAMADFLNRTLHRAFASRSADMGSGKSGMLSILRPGQQVLPRGSVIVDERGGIEARFRVGLPARGRTVLGRQAARLLTEDLIDALNEGLLFDSFDEAAVRRHLETVEDARALRDQLARHGLVAFIADGAILPRRSGVDDRPLSPERARPFVSPPELRVTLEAPNAGAVTGMGIPTGVTLIVGGGYHGKTTLLQAVERGVYDHIPGDGRERVVTVPGAVKVQAESGRSIAGTDISNFIGRLPVGDDTTHFETRNASGSTSQAAAIVEAIEAGATCLLLDEDTSATNFLIRDGRMQALIPDAFEPITPLIDRVRPLAELGISTLMVVGGSGDYFDVADTVIAMVEYEPREVTAEAKRIAASHPTGRRAEGGAWESVAARVPLPESVDPSRGRRELSIKTFSRDRLLFGTEEVDLSAITQIVETAQVRAIAAAIARARGRALDGRRPMAEVLRAIMETVEREGLLALDRAGAGELAMFRIHELAAVLNRIRTLTTRPLARP